MYALLADIIAVIHFGIVVFCVLGVPAIFLGAALKWAWVRNLAFRIIHLGTVVVVALQAIFGVDCPLTVWEHELRRMAGQRYEADITFVARLVRAIIFHDLPPWVFTILYVVFGAIVVLTCILVRPRWGRKQKPEPRPAADFPGSRSGGSE